MRLQPVIQQRLLALRLQDQCCVVPRPWSGVQNRNHRLPTHTADHNGLSGLRAFKLQTITKTELHTIEQSALFRCLTRACKWTGMNICREDMLRSSGFQEPRA